MKEKSIRLHPKHGLNPTIPLCWWCGKTKNEVALLGAAYKGEAPREMLLDYLPCDDCRAVHKQGLLIIEALVSRAGDEPQRTGKWCVMKREAAARVFNVDTSGMPMIYIDPETWQKLGLPIASKGEEGDES